jgi:hypothetical protein
MRGRHTHLLSLPLYTFSREPLWLLEDIPLLAAMVERIGAESIDLSNRISIEVHCASIRAVRGYTLVACVLDEVAYWHGDESARL